MILGWFGARQAPGSYFSVHCLTSGQLLVWRTSLERTRDGSAFLIFSYKCA